jgi:hypothetical protein
VIHWDSFLFPAALILWLQVLEEAKNQRGRSPSPDLRSALVTPSLTKISANCQANSPAGKAEYPIRVAATRSAFYGHAQRSAFRRRDVRLQSRSFAR